jgi:hypothetical protein
MFVAACCAVLAACAAACSDPVPPPAPSVVPASITESFTGTVPVSGTDFHQITINQVSHVSVTLDSVTPAAALGVGIGSLSNGICLLVSQNSPVVQGATAVLSGTALAGTVCVSVFDIGSLVEPVTYTISVAHS